MDIIYLMIIILPCLAELLPEINTAGKVRKFALCMLCCGGVIAFIGKGSQLICVAIAILYFEKLVYHYAPKVLKLAND